MEAERDYSRRILDTVGEIVRGLRTSAAAAMRCACTSGAASCTEPFGNQSRFQVVMRIRAGSVDSPSAKATTKDASKPKNERLIAPRLYQFVIAVWRAKEHNPIA